MTICALSDSQAAAMLAAAARTREPARDAAIVAICLDAGPHRRELVATKRRDFDVHRTELALGSGTTLRLVRLGVGAGDAVEAAMQPDPDGPLLTSRSGAPLTERTVHEQLLTISSLAGLGHWIAARHLRRTFLAYAARAYSLPVALRVAGHGSKRYVPASIGMAVAFQFELDWSSPLDRVLDQATERRAA